MSARTATVFDADMRRDHRDAGMRHDGFERLAQAQFNLQHTQRAATEQRQRAMRRNGADGFGIGIVITELFFLGRFLAFHHGGRDDALIPQAGTQFSEQLGSLGKTLDQNVPRTLKRGFCVRYVDGFHAFGGRLHDQILRGLLLGVERRIGKERIGQRLQPRLARNLRSRAALGLVGQVEVFQRLLGLQPPRWSRAVRR